MNILVISRDSSCAPIAHWFQRKEGHQVKLYIHNPEEKKEVYAGLLERINDYRDARKWCDWIYFGENKMVDVWQDVMKWGKPVYGGSKAGNELEKDRPGAHKIMESLGVKCPESIGVKTTDEAIEHLEEHQVKHVLKFTGGNTDSDDVFLGEYDDNRDLILLCKRIEGEGKHWDEIEIEEFIDGIEVGVAAYFDGKKFAPGIEINFQMKRFASGEGGNGTGFLTGEMGTAIRYVPESNALFQKVLAPLAPHLRKIGYRGEIDVGTIVDKKGEPHFIEYTPRTGYPDCVIRLELQVTPLSELCYRIAKGDVRENQVKNAWAMGAVVVSPGFPYHETANKKSRRLPVIGYEGNEDHCHLFGVKEGDNGIEVSLASCGYPLVVTGSGPTPESAKRRTYWLLNRSNENRVYVPKSWYRDDLAERVIQRKDDIISLGIMTEDEWSGAALKSNSGGVVQAAMT